LSNIIIYVMNNTPDQQKEAPMRSKWLVFVLVAIAQFMVVLDAAITNVALPTIKQQLNFTDSTLQWVVTAYALTFGGFLLLGGRVADLFGRRRTLMAGMAAFTVFSFLIGISHSVVLLIAFRALQGMSAAFMSPAALSIVLTTFRDGPARNRALAFWTLVATAGAAVGLLLGGALTQYVGWRWDFFINVPVGIIMSILIVSFVPAHSSEERSGGLDVPGAALITSSLMLAVLAFSQAGIWGWTSFATLAVLALAAALAGLFVFNESKARHPLVPLSIFRIRNVSGANLIMAPMYGTMMGIFFIVTLYVQSVLNYSPVRAGLAFLPFPIVLGIMSTRIPKLVARYGFKRFLIMGPLTVAAGLLWLSRMPVDGSYMLSVLPALLVIPFGVGMTFMPVIAAATSGVPSHESGLASGLITTSQQMGGAVGLAVLSGVAASVTAGSVHLGPAGSLVHGFDRAMLVAVGFSVLAAALAALVIRQPQSSGPKPQPEPEVQPQPRARRRLVTDIRPSS
jgi:EmrB/QacA subfamily drug resistance transporter